MSRWRWVWASGVVSACLACGEGTLSAAEADALLAEEGALSSAAALRLPQGLSRYVSGLQPPAAPVDWEATATLATSHRGVRATLAERQLAARAERRLPLVRWRARGLADPSRAPAWDQDDPNGDGPSADYEGGPANCAPTSLAMAAAYFGHPSADPERLVSALREAGSTQVWGGTPLPGVLDMADELGLVSVTLALNTSRSGAEARARLADFLRAQLSLGRLVVLRLDGHYALATGWDDEVAGPWVNDPYDGSQVPWPLERVEARMLSDGNWSNHLIAVFPAWELAGVGAETVFQSAP